MLEILFGLIVGGLVGYLTRDRKPTEKIPDANPDLIYAFKRGQTWIDRDTHRIILKVTEVNYILSTIKTTVISLNNYPMTCISPTTYEIHPGSFFTNNYHLYTYDAVKSQAHED